MIPHDLKRQRGIPTAVRMTAYLLCGFLIITNVRFSSSEMAQVVFGAEIVLEQYERLATIIFGKDGFGYGREERVIGHLFRVVTFLMLVNRNPYIDVFTIESLRTAKQLLPERRKRNEFPWIARALIYLKILSEDALTDLFGHPETTKWWETNYPDIDPQWLAWIRAYIAQTHRYGEEYRRVVFYHLCVAGRWLKRYHRGIVTPGQWDEALAQEYVTWACNAKRGELVSQAARVPDQKSRADLSLRASSIDGRISALRKFFKAIQRRSYQVGEVPPQRLVLTWNPDEVLVTPENIKRQMVPNPRYLDIAWWHKLTWAAASLSAKDLPLRNAVLQPLAYYRAVGLLWVTAARRSDEIRRLKVGCVSREWVPEMRDEDGNLLEPEEDLCYLRVPVNKMKGEFWVPIPSYTADAIEIWERLRPKLQVSQIDRKEKKATNYLFMTRNKLMGPTFLNDSVIPLLCKVAGLVDEKGVPLRDGVGKITSHRARSTLATWLRSHGLSLIYIAKLLGHTDLKSLPWYLREDKHQFARTVRKHNPLDRMVMAILDTEALKQGTGEPAVFYFLGYGPDGRPHMCASPDYKTCIHQMKCTECEMHVDAEQAEVIASRPGVLTIEVHIPMPPLLADLLDHEEDFQVEVARHLPAPEVPSPAYHFNKNIPPRESDPELDAMKKELAALTSEWAEKEGKFDMRSAAVKSLKKRMADLVARIEAREAIGPESNPT